MCMFVSAETRGIRQRHNQNYSCEFFFTLSVGVPYFSNILTLDFR